MDKFDHMFIAPKNYDKSLEFYSKKLGWKVVSDWGGNGEERGSVLKSDSGFAIVIAERHHDHDDKAWDSGINGNRPTIHLETKNLKERFQNLPKGDHIVVEPVKTHWGTNWFVIKDPDDNLIAFNES